MHQTSMIKNPKTSQFNITFLQTLNTALYYKELFYYQNQRSKTPSKIDKYTYNEAKKLLTNLETIYFDLDDEEKKLYKHLEKIIINYTLQK